MERSICEVIGCRADGVWSFFGDPDPYCEDVLCDACRQRLQCWHPENAARYLRIDPASNRFGSHTAFCVVMHNAANSILKDNTFANPDARICATQPWFRSA